MKALPRLAACLALGWATGAGAAKPQAAWRDAMPAGWLVAVEAHDLPAVERTVAQLANPWGVVPLSLSKVTTRLLPGVDLAPGPWGLVLTKDTQGGVAPVLYLPAPNYDAVCDALQADRAGEMAVAEVAGFEVALTDRGEWVEASLLDARPRPRDDASARNERTPAVEGEMTVAVSPEGLAAIAETLTRRRRGQLETGQGRIGPWRWPEGLEGYVERLAHYHPLLEAVAAWETPVAIALTAKDDTLTLRVATDLGAGEPALGTPPSLSIASQPIADLSLAGPLPPRLVEVAIAWLRCRPDEIDAAEYPQPQWDELAEAYRQLLSRCQSAALLLALPEGEAPLATNSLAAFTWGGEAGELGDALRLMTLRWNQLIDAAAPPSPLRIEMAPLGEGREGWRFNTDLFEGFGLERSPEVEAVFNRYYGDDVFAIEIERRNDASWLVGYGKRGPRATEGVQIASRNQPLASGEFQLDRWLAWRQQIEDFDWADAVGRRSRPPMAASPPALLRAQLEGGLRVEATLPWATYEAAAAWLRSPTQPK